MSLAKARDAREEARRQLASGVDPSAARQDAKRRTEEASANSFETVAREWLEIVKPAWAAIYYSDTGRANTAYQPAKTLQGGRF